MDNVPGIAFGLLILLVPTGLLAWSVFTERGRTNYERNIRESEEWPKMGGLIPLKPPRTALARWAYSHPLSAATVGISESGVVYAVSRVALDVGHGEAVADAIFCGLEGFVILALIFRQFSKHYGRPTGEGAKAA